jgi:hypothetical protein
MAAAIATAGIWSAPAVVASVVEQVAYPDPGEPTGPGLAEVPGHRRVQIEGAALALAISGPRADSTLASTGAKSPAAAPWAAIPASVS